MSDAGELFQFPCDFPIKVMGRDSESFRTLTLAIVERHAGPLAAGQISERMSREGRFLALTYTIRAALPGAKLAVRPLYFPARASK